MPNIDTKKLEAYAQRIYERENQFNNYTLKTIARRIKNIGQLSAYDQEALKNMADITGDMDKITKELARITKMNIEDIEKVYAQVMNDSVNTYKPLYDFKGMKFVPITENDYAMKLVRNWSELTAEEMINLSHTKALGFVDNNGNFTQLAGAFQQTIDDAVVAVSAGTSDFNSTMKMTIEQLGGSGVQVWYGGGVHRSLEAMVRQNLLWGAKEAAQSYDDYISEELGLDGFEVDAHSGCRPSHEFMQGKFYSYKGDKVIDGVLYEDGSEALKRLKDYGCLHFKTGVLLGVSEPRYSKEELEKIHKETTEKIEYEGREKTLYEWKQTQRRLEREYRKAQTQSDMFKESGNNIAAKDFHSKAKAIKSTYDDLTDKVPGLYNNSERMRTYFKNANSLTNGGGGGIMKLAGGNISQSKEYTIHEDKESVVKLEKRIKEELGITRVDFELLANADVASELMDYVEELQKKHGERFNAVIAQRVIGDSLDLAWVSPSRELFINADCFNSREATKDALKKLLDNHFLPKGEATIEFVARHEYAHLITMNEINNARSHMHTLYSRADKENLLISGNSAVDTYEFVADSLATKKQNKYIKEVKRFFKWGDVDA